MAVPTGKTTTMFEAIVNLISTNHQDHFDTIKLSSRNPFEAIEAGDMDRTGSMLLITRITDSPTRRGGRGQRVASSVVFSLFVVVALHGRSDDTENDGRTYTDSIKHLYNLCDAVCNTLESATTNPATTYAGFGVGSIQDVPDPDNLFLAANIEVNTIMTRI